MGSIGIFGGVNLYEPEDISPNSSSWNSNCFYDKGKLIFQKYLVDKKPILTEMYEREYYNKTTVDAGGTALDIYERKNYLVKGTLAFEHHGDNNSDQEHGIPKPSVRLHFDYNNDPDIPEHYHNILDKIKEKDVIASGYYDGIVRNLEESDMVSDCEIAVSYSGPYGESGLTIFKVANYIPYFFLEIPLFEKLNAIDSYDTFKNIKYLNVYVKYNFMTDYLLINRYDFDTNGKNKQVGHRNRHTSTGSHGMDFRYPFIEYKEIDYPLLWEATDEDDEDEEDPREKKNVLWFSSGLFAYENEEEAALQWFVPNRITSNAPMLITEEQTYVADDDAEVVDDSSYEELKEFWNSDSLDPDDEDYDSGNDMVESIEWISAYLTDPGPGEDRSFTEIQTTEYKNNAVSSLDIETLERCMYEIGDQGVNHYVVKSEVCAPITHQFARKDGDATGAMEEPRPYCQSVVFQKGEPGENREVLFDGNGEPSRDSVTFEVVVNKYYEIDNKRIFIEPMHMTGTAKFFDFELQNCVFNEDDDTKGQYLYQVWLKNTELDGGYMLVQEVDYKSWKNYISAGDDRYEIVNDRYIATFNSHKPSYNIKTKGNIDFKVEPDVYYDSVYNKDYKHNYYSSNNSSGSDNALILHKGRHKDKVAYTKRAVYRLYGSAAIYTGGGTYSHDGGFVSIAEFYNGEDGWRLYVGFNPAEVIEKELYSDFQETVDLTIQSIEYNYDELYKIVKNGVAIEGPNEYEDMYQKQTVSKHEVYMDRLFKTIDDDETNTSLMYFSEQSYPETFSPSNLFKFERKVVHLEAYRQRLYIFMDDRIKVLSGSNNLTFILDKFYSDGAYEWTVVESEDVLYFTNEKGIYRITGGYPELLSANIQKFFDEKLINPEFAEVLVSESCGDFYVLNLKDSISPMTTEGVEPPLFSKLLGTGITSDNGLGWRPSTSSTFYAAADKRFKINKIAVSLRTGEIWFGTEEDTDEFLWKSSEIHNESIFLQKKIKKVALDFSGQVGFVFSKHRNDPVTFFELPLTSSAENLNEPNYNGVKYSKRMPTFHNVAGETVFSYNVLFLSLRDDTKLYKWGVTEDDYR